MQLQGESYPERVVRVDLDGVSASFHNQGEMLEPPNRCHPNQNLIVVATFIIAMN